MNPKTNVYKPSYSNEVVSTSINDISTRSLNTVAIGEESGKSALGENNVFLGHNAGYNAKLMSSSVFIGRRAGYNAYNGQDNVYLGSLCGENVHNGSFNTIGGSKSVSFMQNGNNNTVFGYNIGQQIQSSENNTIIGTNSSTNLYNSSFSVIIGSDTANLVNGGTSNIFIGTDNNSTNSSLNNTVVLGNHNLSIDNTVIVGNNNQTTSRSSIIVGTNTQCENVATFTDNLRNYDALLATKAKARLGIKELNISPTIDNVMYKSFVEQVPASKMSYRNDIETTTIDILFDITQINNDIQSVIYDYRQTDNIIETNIPILYNLTKPVISQIESHSNVIPISSLSTMAYHPYKIIVTSQPQFGFIDKLVYEPHESIIIHEYTEFGYERTDAIDLCLVQYDVITNFDNPVTIQLQRVNYVSNNNYIPQKVLD